MKRFWAFLAMLLLLSGLIGPAVSAQGPEAQPPKPSGPAATGTAPEGLPPAVEAGPTAVWPGPDGFGYLGQTTPFNYVDIHTTGTLISGLTDDSYAGPFPIGFTFNFYGVGKTQFYVSSNGHIEFDAGSSSLYAYCPYPNASNPANHVALMFDDLYPNYSTGGVYRQTFASCPYPGYAAQQCLVVQYYNWYHYPGSSVAGDFEVILTSGGDMIFQYNDGGAENCSNSVEGIQGNNVPGDHGLQYACRQANSCPDGTAFKIGLPTGVIVTPEFSHQEDCSGVTVQHAFTVRNYTGQQDTFNITCSGYTWPTTCPATVGPIPQGGSAPFEVQVTIPNNVCPGATDLVDILVQAQSSPYSATVAAETQLNPATQPTWELRATSPNSSMDDVVYYWDAGVGPRVYRIGGYGANGSVNIYNPATNSWTTGAAEPAPAIAYTVDGCLGLNASGQDIIAIFNDTASGATVWHIYNIDTNSWSTAAVPSGFPANGLWATDVAAGLPYGTNLCYISGGATAPGGGNTNALYRYDPAAHTITNLGNFSLHPAGFDFHSSWYIPPGILPGLPSGGVCVGGGVDSSSVVFADTQCYNFATNAFNSPNADLGQLLLPHWGGADFVLDPPGPDFQLWIVNGVDAAFALWPHSMYYSVLDGAWHYGPDPAAAVYRVEGDAFGMDAYVVNGSTGGFAYSNINQHLKQPCAFNMGVINGYVMDAQTGCSQATCTPAAVHLEPAGIDIPADASGYYTATVPACTYEATASAPGYQPDGPYTVPVTTTAPVQQDFCLNRPDIEVNPTAFDVIGYYSTPITLPLEISNAGYPTLTWQILEIPPTLAAEGDLVVRPAYFGVDDYIAEEFAASTDGKADIFLAFAGEVDLSPATRIKDWEARGRWVVDTLQALADRSQANVRKWLEAQGIEYTVNLNNTIFVRLTQEQFEAALRFPEVVGAFGNHVYPLEPIVDPNAPVPNATVDWGLIKVRAPETWADFGARGQGIVVANIDTGVQWNHPALDQAYLCPGNPTSPRCWYDPSNTCGGSVCDNVGHGTHTMGTMVGDDDPSLTYIVGMAPDAGFIMCKGCESNFCSNASLIACANWVLQPDNNPANRPHIVNNSWGGGGCNTWYQTYVQAWRAAGIFPAFSIGNSGPGCNTAGSPGDYPESFSSGATDSNDAIASFSSRGPSCWGEIKPEVSAPGVNICSSVPTNSWNCGYSGTSMASPHTAGLAAMLWSCNPTLVGNIAATEYIITSTAVCIQDLSCGGTACPDGANNVFGWGRIDAYAAAQAGCIQDIPWVWESPITGTTPPGGTSLVDVTFHCPVSNVVDLTGTLRIINNDPCENPVDIPLVLHCMGQCEPLTSVDFTWNPLNPPAGTPVVFTATYQPPTASIPIDFTWNFGDGNYDSGITATHVYAAPGDYVVTLTATNPCSVLVVQYTVPVTQPLAPDIEVSPLELFSEQCPDTVTTQTLTICNVGASPLTWSLSELSMTLALAGTPFVPAGRPAPGPVPSLPVSTYAVAYRPVRPAPAVPDDVLWDQPLGANTTAYANQDFETIYDAYDIFIADDFTNADPWEITTIFVPGNTWNAGGDLTCANTLNWQIYADNAGVPAGDPWSGGALWNLSLPPSDPQVVLSAGVGGYLSNVTLNLNTPIILPPGTYWLVFYPQMDFDTCFQYGRHASPTTNGYDAQVINPGGGFGFPTTWTSVRDPSTWGLTEQDFAFRLEGSIYTPPPVDIPWLSESPVSGTVAPGECTTVTVLFDSTGMAPGTYGAGLLITSNDPDEPEITIPVTMTVDEPLHDVDFTWTPPTPVVGEVVTFQATAAGTAPITYDWDFGDGGTASGITATHTYTAPGDYVITLIVGNVCGQVVVTHTVSVVPPCVPPSGADFSWAPLEPVVGELVTFTGSVVSGTEPLTWEWDFGDGGSGTGNPATHIYGAPGDYTVVMTVSNACGFEVVTYTVAVAGVCVPPAGADFSWAPPEPVVGELVHFTGTVASGTPPFTYEWDFGDGGSGSGPNPTHVYAAPGDYTVVMTVTNACGEDTATYIIHVVEGCVPPEGVDFTWAPTSPFVGEAAHFTATVTSGTPPFTYAWAFGDGGVGSGQVVAHTYAATGTYGVLLTVTNACGQATATHSIVVRPVVPTYHYIYLPLVFKGYP